MNWKCLLMSIPYVPIKSNSEGRTRMFQTVCSEITKGKGKENFPQKNEPGTARWAKEHSPHILVTLYNPSQKLEVSLGSIKLENQIWETRIQRNATVGENAWQRRGKQPWSYFCFKCPLLHWLSLKTTFKPRLVVGTRYCSQVAAKHHGRRKMLMKELGWKNSY